MMKKKGEVIMDNERKNFNKSIDQQLDLARVKANFPIIQEFMEVIGKQYPAYARQLKMFYDALVEAGFTKQEALEIVKIKGWAPTL